MHKYSVYLLTCRFPVPWRWCFVRTLIAGWNVRVQSAVERTRLRAEIRMFFCETDSVYIHVYTCIFFTLSVFYTSQYLYMHRSLKFESSTCIWASLVLRLSLRMTFDRQKRRGEPGPKRHVNDVKGRENLSTRGWNRPLAAYRLRVQASVEPEYKETSWPYLCCQLRPVDVSRSDVVL